MRHYGMIAFVLAIALSIACGKSEEEKAAEKAAQETKEAAEALKRAAEKTGQAAATQGLEAAAKALEGVAGALSGTTADGKPIEPVSFQVLQTTLPEVDGWKREQPTGERMTSPVPLSQAETTYANGDAQVEVKVVDSAFSQLLLAPWSMFLASGYEKQTRDGYEKAVSVGGMPGFEKWDTSSKQGELNLVVGKRFLVTIEGNNINDTKVLHEFASKIDTSKLASLK